MKENSTTTDTDGTTLFAGDAWFDPIEAGIRDRVRVFIEELLEQEVTAALGGRSKHERAVEHRQGYRNGTRERQPAEGQLRRGIAQRAAGAPGEHGRRHA